MIVLALLSLSAWLYILIGRGMFWLLRERDDDGIATPGAVLPRVVAVVPARDEADVIARAITSLLEQDYAGSFRIVLVDDGSSDGTANVAKQAALTTARSNLLEIVSGTERPGGWTGKLWAMKQGLARATFGGSPDYLLFTDADIAHARESVSRLVARAEARHLVLASLMAKLKSQTGPEKLLIPAFVFFFAMLFPFSWVNDPRRKTAAAAGGCMLVQRQALEAAGGLERIANAIIDDCALARILKARGSIWLGLTENVESLRPYVRVEEIGHMVARSAYAQLRYSPLLLGATLSGMAIVYGAPVLLAFFGDDFSRIVGMATWLLMGLLFQPMLRFYRLSPLWGLALPLTGAVYELFTLQSAVQHWRGRGGMWKGRAQAMA